jgi:hypothetical protein
VSSPHTALSPAARRGLALLLLVVALALLLAYLRATEPSSPGGGTGAPGTTSPGGTVAPGTVAPGAEPPGVLPLPATHPVRNPAVTDTNLATTVCRGTAKYRPPVAYTDAVKRIELSTPVGQSGRITDPRTGRVYEVPGYRGYAGLGPGDAARVELDHLLPLSDGGDGYDPANLWPQIGGTAGVALTGADGGPANSRVKDRLENWVYHQLCPSSGPRRMSLAEAQALYEPDWYASYLRLGIGADAADARSDD